RRCGRFGGGRGRGGGRLLAAGGQGEGQQGSQEQALHGPYSAVAWTTASAPSATWCRPSAKLARAWISSSVRLAATPAITELGLSLWRKPWRLRKAGGRMAVYCACWPPLDG